MSKKLDFQSDRFYHIKDLYNNYFNLINTVIIVFIILIIALIYTSKVNFSKENTNTINIDIEESGITTEETSTTEPTENIAPNKSNQKSYVYISGEVKNTGVYELTENLRVKDLIELAGGITENGSLENINLAQKLYDEDHIVILSQEEILAQGVSETSTTTSDTLININSASKEELLKIKGVGEVTADNIIEYREKNGKFESKEDLKNVTGIGDKTYEKLEDQIKVN